MTDYTKPCDKPTLENIGLCLISTENLKDLYAENKRLKKQLEASYTAHDVAEILADAIGDDCACNVNGNDEWLPFKCELQEACPSPEGVACWEQYLKWRGKKDNKEDTV